LTSKQSLVKPLLLHRPEPSAELADRLAEVAALSLAPAALSALETVLRAEQAFLLREAAFSSDAEARLEYRGAFKWVEAFLNGVVMAKYAEQAKDRLREASPEEGIPVGGSPYMDPDGLEE